jgi:hypothetical protein
MKAFIAFCFGLIFTVALVWGLELWCKKEVNSARSYGFEQIKLTPVEELKKMYKYGIFPDPPEVVPVEKRYFTPFDHSNFALHEFHHFMDKRYHPSSHRHVMKRPDGKILSDISFYFDKYERRITPANDAKKKASKFIAMFGDSNILGYGLPQDKTIANMMSEQMPDTKVYNYSQSGIYPYEILGMTERFKKQEEIPEQNGIGLYFYLAYHIKRNMGSFHELGLPWTQHRRAVDIDQNGEFMILRPFKEERPIWYRLTPLLRESWIVRYFNLDLKPGDRDFRIETALVKRMRKNLAQQGIKKFYVVIHPLQHLVDDTQKLISYLDKEQIPFIYLAHWQMEHLTEGPVTLVFDGHYSANANKVLADGLLRILGPELKKDGP